MISTQDLRELFLNYFKEKGHTIIPSSALVPSEDDKSLLFVNAGMVPFKAQFSGREPIKHLNVTSIQRCVRAGGKHNDLENVGYTARHHTFFEMLGNFSFGDYFKRKAIHLAWAFLTEVLKLPSDKLWVTVYKEDQQAADIWLNELKIDPLRFSYCDDADNFWAMGDVGPCGPCSEIFYDHGPSVQGGPPGSPNADGDRYVEIWNLVFMQYEKKVNGELVSLPKPCVDTGMGLERLCAVMQGVVSNYEIDLFKVLIKAVQNQFLDVDTVPSHTLKVIADHIRSIGFLIMDGVTPHNEGRSYVLRRIIRRALKYGYQSGLKEPFLYRLIPTLVDEMKVAYPDLSAKQGYITQVLLDEEKQFLKTLHQGLQYFEKAIADLEGERLQGSLVFKLYDTYGFPVDLTAELAQERGLSWDEAGFKAEMDLQKKRSQARGVFSNASEVRVNLSSAFKGYVELETTSRITGLLDQAYQSIEALKAGDIGSVILDETPFYAESGGQVGDQGDILIIEDGAIVAHFAVSDTQKKGNAYLHQGELKQGTLKIGDTVEGRVEQKRRQAIKRHHSATHLLHAALRELLGTNVVQKGSLVSPGYLRFDFYYPPKLTQEAIQRIEQRVNQVVWKNLPVKTELMSLEDAKKGDVISLFDDKYQDQVRVLSMGDFSKELCGGTHVAYTGELGYFAITLSTSVASGIKRIEAVTGEAAFEWIKTLQAREGALAALLKTNADQLVNRVEKQIELAKQQKKDMGDLKQYIAHSFGENLAKKAIKIGEVTLVLAVIPSVVTEYAREIIDQIKTYFPSHSVIALGYQNKEEIQINMGISRHYTHVIKAQEVLKKLPSLIEGKGGGRDDFAQIKAKGDSQTLQRALKEVQALLENMPQAIKD